jgi:tol-pal system protein YbgF
MTHRTLRTAAFTVLAALAGAAPAAAANKEHQQLAADVRMLQEQAQRLQILLASLTKAIEAVNARLDQQAEADRKTYADSRLLIDNLTSDVRVVREKVDDNNVRVGSLAQELESLRELVQEGFSRPPPVALDVSAAAAPPDGAPGAPDPSAVPTPAPPAPVEPLAAGSSPRRMYDQAYGDYTAGLYELAIDGFEAYLRDFPKSDMADEAQLYIGNAALLDKKDREAVEAYDKVIRTYPASNSVPEAYYKMGLALRNLREIDRAREAWEFLVTTYPDSTAAILAKQALASSVPNQ